MNNTIQKMTEHVSVRDFQDTPLTSEQKMTLLQAAQSGATSHFVQAYSILEITDPAIRAEIGRISKCAAYVEKNGALYVFIADFYRQATLLEKAGKEPKGIRNPEALTVAIVDATIAAQNMVVAAESMDLGICYIGALRNDINRVAELLDLPPFTYPLFAMCVGIPASKNDKKPRLPLKNLYAENTYDKAAFTDMADFDQTMLSYYESRNSNQKSSTWSEQMVSYLQNEIRPDVADFLKKQGFVFE